MHFKDNEYEVLIAKSKHSKKCGEIAAYRALFNEYSICVCLVVIRNEIVKADEKQIKRFQSRGMTDYPRVKKQQKRCFLFYYICYYYDRIKN